MANSPLLSNILQYSIKNLAQNILQICQNTATKIMTIESMTGGHIIDSLTSVPGYSEAIFGSAVVYHNNAKNELLGEFEGSVYSKEYAQKMCFDALTNYSVDIIVSVTGIADPTDHTIEDYSSIFYCGIGIRKNNNEFSIISKKIVLSNAYLRFYKENNSERREVVKMMATKKALSYLFKTINNIS